MAAHVGARDALHSTALGKAILSAIPAVESRQLLTSYRRQPATAHTIVDLDRLLGELAETAERGYSIDDEEIVLGVRCVGAPIVDGQQRVRGAISVAGPAYRLTVSRLELLGPEVEQAARRIGQQLAGSGTLTGDGASTLIDGQWAFEGAFPRWSPFEQCLYWADALAPAVRCFDGKEDRALAMLASPIAGLVPDEHGVLVRREGAWDRVDREGRSRAVSAWPDAPLFALCRAPDGELWASQPSGAEWKVGTWSAEQRFRVHWRVSERVDALAWNTDGSWLYAAAPESGSIYRMQPGQRIVRRLATMPKGSGRISGLALDASEGIWTALTGGWGVVRFAPDGTLDRVVGLPVPSPTGVCVGGPDRSVLYVTSARHEVPIEMLADAPLSGRLFAVPTEVGGIT
jgi:sugar lactone lactonase YvrE